MDQEKKTQQEKVITIPKNDGLLTEDFLRIELVEHLSMRQEKKINFIKNQKKFNQKEEVLL